MSNYSNSQFDRAGGPADRVADESAVRAMYERDPYPDLNHGTRTWLRNQRGRSRRESWSPPWRERFTAPTSPWIDHFCHPCECAYEVPQVRALVEQSGFRVVQNMRRGVEHPQLIPPGWRERYETLDEWDKRRLSELLADGGGSFAMWLRKA